MIRIIEIRSYRIKESKREEFHRLVSNFSYPLMKRWGIDVVAFGPSLHDSSSYVLIRSYENEAERILSQERFYGSDDWRSGPRESIIALIESDSNVVLEITAEAINAIKKNRVGISNM